MAAPDYVPVSSVDAPRAASRLPGHPGWTATRPGDLGGPQPLGPQLGRPGPDQGYALTLGERFADRVQVDDGEHRADAVHGCCMLALKRASLFGRAPTIYDLELAFSLWGFLGGAPPELRAYRRPRFEGARHHGWDPGGAVEAVPAETLRLTPEEVRARLADWRSLLPDRSVLPEPQ